MGRCTCMWPRTVCHLASTSTTSDGTNSAREVPLCCPLIPTLAPFPLAVGLWAYGAALSAWLQSADTRS